MDFELGDFKDQRLKKGALSFTNGWSITAAAVSVFAVSGRVAPARYGSVASCTTSE